jgi:antitoxin (DNA-binding transcriptional repressor) of toxin-antitoxin stability system
VATPDTPLRLACLIPCFNEALVLRDTLACVLAAGLRPDDVFVVDDCSSDETGLIAASFGVRILRNARNMGKSKSIARAIDEVVALGRHDFVSVLDADTLVDRDYFSTVVRTFRADPDVVLLCGQPRSRRHNWLTAYRAVEYALSLGIYKQAQQKMRAITCAPGCASTYRITVLEHLEWNPAILTEDADTTVQVYRKDLYDAKGLKPAETYDQLVSNAKALTDPGTRTYGLALRGFSGAGQNMYIYPSLFRGFGGSWMQGGGVVVNSAPAVQALQWYVDEACKAANLQCNMRMSDNLERLPADLEIALYRLVQESVTNVVKHAKAKTIDLTMERVAKGLRVTIADDGVGIADLEAAKRLSHGLAGMSHRIRSVHGTFDIRSNSGNGTRIDVFVPLEPKKPVAEGKAGGKAAEVRRG